MAQVDVPGEDRWQWHSVFRRAIGISVYYESSSYTFSPRSPRRVHASIRTHRSCAAFVLEDRPEDSWKCPVDSGRGKGGDRLSSAFLCPASRRGTDLHGQPRAFGWRLV